MNFSNRKSAPQKSKLWAAAGMVLLIVAMLWVFSGWNPDFKKILSPYEEWLRQSISGTSPSSELEVHFIDVGQGDSTLILTPAKESILIDAGYETAGKKVVHYLLDQNIVSIDYLIATHSDLDHIGGMKEVYRAFDVRNFCIPATVQITPELEDLLDCGSQKNSSILRLKSGDALDLKGDLSAFVLNPIRRFYLDANQYSIVLLLEYQETSFLFPGDATEANEKEILRTFPHLRADVLKAAHHGSSTSTKEEFLQQLDPQAVLISCGYKNDYAHPSPQTVSLLEKYKIPLYRTDEQGSIVFYSNGKQITVDQKSPASYTPGKKSKN